MREKITAYLNEYMKRPVQADEALISDGILDSLGMLRLMLFLEKECGLDTADPYFDVEALDSVNDIVELLTEQHSS